VWLQITLPVHAAGNWVDEGGICGDKMKLDPVVQEKPLQLMVLRIYKLPDYSINRLNTKKYCRLHNKHLLFGVGKPAICFFKD
jgi:hypothetical protein